MAKVIRDKNPTTLRLPKLQIMGEHGSARAKRIDRASKDDQSLAKLCTSEAVHFRFTFKGACEAGMARSRQDAGFHLKCHVPSIRRHFPTKHSWIMLSRG